MLVNCYLFWILYSLYTSWTGHCTYIHNWFSFKPVSPGPSTAAALRAKPVLLLEAPLTEVILDSLWRLWWC
jgi:hypothetical protein